MRIKRFEHPLLPSTRVASNGPSVFTVTKNPAGPNNGARFISTPQGKMAFFPEEEKVISESLLPMESLLPEETLLPE